MKNYTITVNGNVYEVSVEEGFTSTVQTTQTLSQAPRQAAAPQLTQQAPVTSSPVTQNTGINTPVTQKPITQTQTEAKPQSTGGEGAIKVNAPMPGKILGVKVSVGQTVKRGDVVVILEAMKMENEIVASSDGVVASINVSVGANVESGEVLATLN